MPLIKDKPVVKVLEVEEVTPFDPWIPVLKNSPSLQTTPEQELYIREILEICCSDSAFAKKCYIALQHILTGSPAEPATVTSITPTTAVVGTPVSLSVSGTGFTSTSVISFGGPVATTFVSETELTASVVAPATAGDVAVTVDTDGLVSEPVTFTVTDVLAFGSNKESKKDLGSELKKEK